MDMAMASPTSSNDCSNRLVIGCWLGLVPLPGLAGGRHMDKQIGVLLHRAVLDDADARHLGAEGLGLAGDEQRESGFAGTRIPTISRSCPQMAGSVIWPTITVSTPRWARRLAMASNASSTRADADEEDLAGVSDEIHKCVDLRLVHMVEHVGELLHDDPLAVAE